MKPLTTLFSPIKIGSMEIKNRIAMAPMATQFANPDSTVSQKLMDYHEARAKGGVGLIILGVTTVDEYFPYPVTLSLSDDRFIPGLKALTDIVHKHGAKIIPQITHPGPASLSPFLGGPQPVGPSVIKYPATGQVCRELAIEEIGPIVEQFGEAARRAREAGFDGVELHAAHGYMLAGCFISPLRNRRTDEYGGSIDARLKFPIEVIKCIKDKAGTDFPIILRMSGDELVTGGQDIRQTQYIAPKLVEAGVDAFHISSGLLYETAWRIMPPTGTPLGLNTGFSEAVKKVVDVPVMVVGRINEPLFAEDILEKGQADMVAIGRGLLADPEFPIKAMEGRFDDIAPCTGCSLGCLARAAKSEPLSCVINPAVGKEKEMAIVPADTARKVMVVGAGPAGLEAARVAALRGHDVDLYEKAPKVGGQFDLASVPPSKQEMSKFIKYLYTQVGKVGAKLHLNTEVSSELVDQMKPDVVIVATGGEPIIPDLPGIQGEKVISSHDVLSGKVILPPGNMVVIGGGMVGLEVAEFLADPGDHPLLGPNHITVVEMLDSVGMDLAADMRTLLMKRLRENGVRIITSATVKEILDDGMVISMADGSEESMRGMDRIILAMGAKSVEVLSDEIKKKVAEVYVIGDAKQPRKALEAIAEGSEVGRRV
jgi:NAD(H)-dependent 7beta-hydroxy-3-oxo-delta4-cholenoic acid oxidoreductase